MQGTVPVINRQVKGGEEMTQREKESERKIKIAIDRIKSFEPKEGYYLAFSGGKDSQCIYHLAKMAGVKFDAHYNVTGIDPPEVVRFIKQHYSDVAMDIPKDKNGKRVTMWNLINHNKMPPTGLVRYCCSHLKERGGIGRYCITGVRWAESTKRKNNQGAVTIQKRGYVRGLIESGDFEETPIGGIILINDNDNSRRLMERCAIKGKVVVNPIIDWKYNDVWHFLNNIVKVEHCDLYDDGFSKIGCIGCPMKSKKQRERDFERWPKYKDLYLKAFENMIKNNDVTWETAEEVFRWWIK